MAYPFDDRPGATVGKLQIALANEDVAATRVVAGCGALRARPEPRRFAEIHRGRGHSLARRADVWLYVASVGERFDPDRVERHDHEAAHENLVNADYYLVCL